MAALNTEYCYLMTDKHINMLSEMEFNTWAATQRSAVSSRGPQHEPRAKLVICVCVLKT